MSYHYPHRVGKIANSDRANAKGLVQLAMPCPEPHEARSDVNWREGAAVAVAILVMLVTAWLIWAALAEAVLAAALAS